MKKTKKENWKLAGKVRVISTCAETGKLLKTTPWSKNLIVLGTNLGLNLVMQRLATNNTYTLNIKFGEIGTGTTTPLEADTGMETAVTRVATSYSASSSNVATVQFFFPDSILANGTYTEFGTFVDGTSTLASGQFFNHVLFASSYVKASGVDTTIEVQFNTNN